MMMISEDKSEHIKMMMCWWRRVSIVSRGCSFQKQLHRFFAVGFSIEKRTSETLSFLVFFLQCNANKIIEARSYESVLYRRSIRGESLLRHVTSW